MTDNDLPYLILQNVIIYYLTFIMKVKQCNDPWKIFELKQSSNEKFYKGSELGLCVDKELALGVDLNLHALVGVDQHGAVARSAVPLEALLAVTAEVIAALAAPRLLVARGPRPTPR